MSLSATTTAASSAPPDEMKGKVLVIDDEEVMRDVLKTLLDSEGFRVELAPTASEGLEKMRGDVFDVVLLDLMLPDMDGMDVMQEIRRIDPYAVSVIITAYGSLEKAVKATKLGAFDFITKPFKNDEILLVVGNGIQQRRLLMENLQLKASFKDRFAFKNIVGKSVQMQKIFDFITHVGPSRSTVLIYGESGTGKELVAKAFHVCSPRADGPFVTVNCGNIPTELLESELFGHVKGAYTGATTSKKGLFEIAHGGSLFLDEIGSISFEMQAKLLRVLQEREFRRLGGLENIKVDVRIIAATNIDLQKAVEESRFRDDLYYRLNVISVKLPPLRDRKEDIPLLADHFIHKYDAENGKNIKGIDSDALKLLMEHDWPGNVRELENVVERAVVLTIGDHITQDYFPRSLLEGLEPREVRVMLPEAGISLKREVEDFERKLILTALQRSEGNQKRAAHLLHLNPTTLNEKLKRLNIRPK
jgi:DNA-binding NtrC family response regulator